MRRSAQKKQWKKLFWLLPILVIAVLSVVLINTLRFASSQLEVAPVEEISISETAIQRLSAAIQIPSISNEDYSQTDTASFTQLRKFIHGTWAQDSGTLKRYIINQHSLLYRWKGKNQNLKPILFLAHQDVVPATDSQAWTHPPFSGAVAENFIWGRGAMDDKFSLTALLEAYKILHEEMAFQPQRDIYFGFGHDEEVGGSRGAAEMLKWFKKRNINFEFVLDEGMIITEGIFPGLEKPLALIGLGEKGWANFKLRVEQDGGHSSMPESESSIGILSKALAKIEENPMAAKLREPVKGLLKKVGPELPFTNKMAMANLWLFEKTILKKFSGSPSTNASVRTTAAITMFNAGVKSNVLAPEAEAIINFRIYPGETWEDVKDYLVETINDERVKIELQGNPKNPSQLSPNDGAAFKQLEKTIRQIYPETIVASSLVIAGTDSRYFEEISQAVYRFVPLPCNSADLKRIHGVDERIAVEDYKNVIRFYTQLIQNLDNI